MTAQSPEHFTCAHPALELGDWALHGLIRGEPAGENHGWGTGERVARFTPRHAPYRTSSNWKGYHEHYHLQEDGRLALLTITYDEDRSTLRVDEVLGGDFDAVLKSAFFGPRLYVPFRGGVLVSDRTAWKHERYEGRSPREKKLYPGCHPDFPDAAKLSHEVFPGDR